MKFSWICFLSLVCSSEVVAAPFAHAAFDELSLEGAWEMVYRESSWATGDCPAFKGFMIEQAVPGHWEDMIDAFRAAGLDVSAFRTNPDHVEQNFPMTGWAKDTTLPNPYGCFLYRRTFDCDRTGPAVLSFDCVRNEVRAWINGRFIAFRQGFSTPFELAVPDGILKKGVNEIVLAVANTPNVGYNGRDVSGLTTRALFGATGGIEGRVALRFPKNDLGDVHVTTSADLTRFMIHVSGETPFEYEVCDGDRAVRSGAGCGDVTLSTEDLSFWSPESPKRYRLELKTASGGVCSQRFGLRRLTAEGEKLKLNGRPVYLRGVTEHAYFARTTHVPRDLDYWRMVTAKRKELGFNFVRFHTFVPPEEYLEATDELGMLVHIESPNYVPISEYAAIVAFARRHPSVVIYCTGNETQIDESAEAYLRDVASLVHRETDALFSPMSALRGIEYFIREGVDPYVEEPLPHNAERIGRMSAYCDLFTSYQLGVASYNSLNKGSPELLDRWGDAYGGKPRLSHETCIDSSCVDFSTEALYPPDSPVLRAGVFSKLRSYLDSRGVLEKSDLYFRNSCEWMRRIRKFTFEKLRAADRVAGFDFLGDINTHWHTFGYSVGMMDEFYRLKPGETVENVRRYNSAAVLLCDLGSDFNVTAGEEKRITFSVSNYDRKMSRPELRADLVDESGELVSGGCAELLEVPNGRVSKLKTIGYRIPESDVPRKYLLRAKLTDGTQTVANEWEIYAFPKSGKEASSPLQEGKGLRVVTDISESDLQAAMARGERVVLLGAGPFKSLPTTFRIGMAGRCSGNYATVIKKGHPALKGLPHEGFCGWQFRRLLEGGRAIQLEAGVPFDPIVDIASSVKNVIRQSALFEYRVGKGRLLVCSFAFSPDDPAALWLKRRLVDYAASEAFAPGQELSPAQLKAVIVAPLRTGEKNSNEARNANDPASVVGESSNSRAFDMLPGEKWWGAANAFSTGMPFTVNTRLTLDLRKDNFSNQTASLLLSDHGRVLWSEAQAKFTIAEGLIVVESSSPVLLETAGESSLRGAYRHAMMRWFPPSGRCPDPIFFTAPQLNTWIELRYNQNQADILAYARQMREKGVPPGVLMIDDTWQTAYGDWRFEGTRFPDPKGMMDELHRLGYKVMLWMCPYVGMDTPAFRRIAWGYNPADARGWPTKGGFLSDRVTGLPKACSWWNGYSAFLDFSHPNANVWFAETLDGLVRDFGVDGFKFDGGDICILVANDCVASDRKSTSGSFNRAYAAYAERYPFCEFRNAWRLQQRPVVARLGDKHHRWDDLRRCVADMIGAGLLGCPFICPDMVGGGQWMDFLPGAAFDPELFVRSAQMQALCPMMQISASPWRVLDARHQELFSAAIALRQSFAPVFVELSRRAGETGEPMLRCLEYDNPDLGYAEIRDEFLMGTDLLVAPQLVKGAASRKVVVPPGRWRGDDGTEVEGPAVIDVETPLSRIPYFIRIRTDRSIVEFGAKQDGRPHTEAFARAIDVVSSAGGGRVIVPKGTWLTGPLHLKNGVEIRLEDGAVLEFADELADYLPAVPVSWEGIECRNYSPLVYAFGCTNVAVTGRGTLLPRMGQWKKWFARPQSHIDATRKLYDWGSTDVPLEERDLTKLHESNFRPQLIHFNRCKGVRLEDFTVRASPFWTIHLFHSEDCFLRGLDLKAKGHNNDGVDIEMTRNVIVRDCIFEQGDDVVVLKAGRNRDGWRLNRPTENVLVENCEARSGHSLLVVGSELSGGIRNVLMRNCRVTGTNSLERVLRIKTNRRRGGFVRNIRMENVDVEPKMQAVFALTTDALFQWAAFPDYELKDTEIDGVYMKDVHVRDSVKLLEVSGCERTPARNIRLDGVRVDACRFSTVENGGDILVDGKRPETVVRGVTLHVIGDSTSAPRRWALNREDAPSEARHSGSWCEAAQERYVKPGVTIANWARCGWSTKKFIDSGWWTNALTRINRGDFVYFMLGHNDQKKNKPEVYASESDYRANLLRFISEVQAKGAYPFLGTPIVRRRLGADGKVNDGLGNYPDVVRELSRTLSIKMIDMNAATREAVERTPRERSLAWFRGGVDGSDDMTHPSREGADVIARLFAQRARQEAPELAALFDFGRVVSEAEEERR